MSAVRYIVFILVFLYSATSQGQDSVTIKLMVSNQTDEVYITGNQESLGDWDPAKIKMQKISAFEREVKLSLTLPAEFKFTRGSWETEGKTTGFFDENPNIIINNASKNSFSYSIKSWADQTPVQDNFSLAYKIKTSFSNIFNQERTITVSLPGNYDPKKKYSVVYVLDGASWFKNFVFSTTLLSNSNLNESADYGIDNIPEVIIVGVLHNNRGYETSPNIGQEQGVPENEYLEGSEKLKNYLFDELVPYINSNYSTSDYNVIFGHSNTGHFVLNLPFQEKNPFRGIIALSVNGENSLFNKSVENYLKNKTETLYFGFGTEDFGFNELAQSINEKFEKNEINNPDLKVEGFEATHNQLPQLAINSALKFMFKDYKNFNDFEEEVFIKLNSVDSYFKNYIEKNKLYGVTLEISSDNIFTLLEKCVHDKNISIFRELINYSNRAENTHLPYQLLTWASKEIEDLQTADFYIKEIVRSTNDKRVGILSPFNIQNTFIDYYLKVKKDPEQALVFLESIMQRQDIDKLANAYFYVKVAKKYNLEKTKAKKYLEYCKKNFKENSTFKKEDLKTLGG